MPPKKKSLATHPVLDRVVLADLIAGDADDLRPRSDHEGAEFVDLQLDELDLAGARVFGSRFSGLRALEANLRAVTMIETVLERADIPVLRGIRGTWRHVEVRNARIGSAELYDSAWRSVHFFGCKLSFVNLRGADLEDVAFTDCTIDELDLVQARATRVALASTRVRRLDVQAATLKHVDLRSAVLEELSGIESLRGVTISPLQLTDLAPVLAGHLGITVAEQD